jgi:putative hemolysin
LFAAYLAIGAVIAGPPALDREFLTIDFLTILDLDTMSPIAKRYLLSGKG